MSNLQPPIEASFAVIKDVLEDPTGFSLNKLRGVTESIDLKDKKSLIDVALRGRMLRLLAWDSLDDVKTLLKMGVAAALANLCSAPTPFLLFADVFNTKPISVCQELFEFMEETIITLKDVPLFDSGRNTLLRMCNDLLRRLSKSQDTVFCGQIQLFLTRLFPLDEKSGLNFMSNFNTEKAIVYNKSPDPNVFKHQVPTDNTIDDLEEGEMTEQTPPFEVDAGLYVKFWSLQEFFKSPVLCYEKPKWTRFVNSTETVLDIFSSIRLMNTEDNDLYPQCNENKFSKYLTSEKLLDLQLMDQSFRRYILVQMILIFQYLTTTTKFKTADQVLTDEQQHWVNQKRATVLGLLSHGSTSCGSSSTFVSAIEHILERETFWNRWKNDGCPSFIRTVEKSLFSPRKRRLNPLVDRNGQKIYRFGNRELNKLWNVCPDNLEACRDQRRLFNPDLRTYFQDAIIELDPAEKVEEEYKSINKDEWSWRALRFLARSCPHFYINWNPPGRPIKDYLTVILSEKIQTEDDRKHSTDSNAPNMESLRGSDASVTDTVPLKQPRLDDLLEPAPPSPLKPAPLQRTRSSQNELLAQGPKATRYRTDSRSTSNCESPSRTRHNEAAIMDNENEHSSETDEEIEPIKEDNSS